MWRKKTNYYRVTYRRHLGSSMVVKKQLPTLTIKLEKFTSKFTSFSPGQRFQLKKLNACFPSSKKFHFTVSELNVALKLAP